MFIQTMLIIIGFILLIKGADILVEGSSQVAKKLNISEIIIGLTIVSIGTSMPELFVSTTSALQGYSDLSIGNIVGSNICNLLLILGLSSIIRPVEFKRQTKLIENPILIVCSIIFFLICNINNDINRKEGFILIIVFISFLFYTIYMGIRSQKNNTIIQIEENKNLSLIKNIIFIILGISLLKIGGDFVVYNSKMIATTLKVSEKIIGLTIVAIGTSLPELVTSVTAAIKGDSDIAIGNIIGSNIFNMLMIIGITSIIKPIEYNITYNYQMIVLFIGMILMLIYPFIKPKNKLSRWKGLVLLILYLLYLVELIIK